MTPFEATEYIKSTMRVSALTTSQKIAFNLAISALEKQIPTKPNISGTRATVCPSCNRFIDRHEQKHGNIDIPCCKWCGQALDWRNT